MNILVHVSLAFVRASLLKCPNIFPNEFTIAACWFSHDKLGLTGDPEFKLGLLRWCDSRQSSLLSYMCFTRLAEHSHIYFRKQASIILLILQLVCWCFRQSKGQIFCNVSCGQNGKMTKHFYTLQFLDCSRGLCGFSNWWHPLLLVTAVSSIPW